VIVDCVNCDANVINLLKVVLRLKVTHGNHYVQMSPRKSGVSETVCYVAGFCLFTCILESVIANGGLCIS